MKRRFVSIWFTHLLTDWYTRRQAALSQKSFVLAAPDHGRMRVVAANKKAQHFGVKTGMAVADAKALAPELEVLPHQPGQNEKLLHLLGQWCIRYTPAVAIDLPDGLLMDVSGCAQLWGGEEAYLNDIEERIKKTGYQVRTAIADSIGTAWAISHYADQQRFVAVGNMLDSLRPLHPAALRLSPAIVEKLLKLGLRQIGSFIGMQRTALRRRFGNELLLRLDQALGFSPEEPQWLQEPQPYQERLPCLEPIVTAKGIEIALQQLLNDICNRLKKEGKGLRNCSLRAFRTDGRVEEIEIGTSRATHASAHLFRLFELKIEKLAPGPGIELFLLSATKTEELQAQQESIWKNKAVLDDHILMELVDRITNKLGSGIIHRYLPEQSYWPERSIRPAIELNELPAWPWQLDRPRPLQLLSRPERITVSAPIPDYPPMLFRYRGVVHHVKKADGPERIEREWWIEQGDHRDYYTVEDEEGRRFWIFRQGHYGTELNPKWFVHGIFA